MKTDQNFTVPFIMGGSWTTSDIRRVQALFKIGILASQKNEDIAKSLERHFSGNCGHTIVRIGDVQADVHIIIEITDTDALKIEVFTAGSKPMREDSVFGSDASRYEIDTFDTLEKRVDGYYHHFLEQFVADTIKEQPVEYSRLSASVKPVTRV